MVIDKAAFIHPATHGDRRMNLNSCRTVLRQLPIVKALPESMTDGLGMIFMWIGFDERVPDGTVIYEEGDDKDSTGAVLIAGSVAVSCAGSDATLEVAAPELFGEMHQLSETAQRTATVTAKGDVEILRFEWHEFIAMAASIFTPEEQVLVRDAIEGLTKMRQPSAE